MNTFTIVDKSYYSVNLQELDKEVCRFWDVPFNPEQYAVPKNSEYVMGCSWVSIIGNAISNSDVYTHGWAGVVEYLATHPIGKCFIDPDNSLQLRLDARAIDKVRQYIKFYQPYLDLIKHFSDMGLQPKQIKYVK